MTRERHLTAHVRSLVTPDAAPRSDLRAAYIQAVQSTAGDSYRPRQAGPELLRVDNARQGLRADFDTHGAHIVATTGGSDVAVQLVRYGCAGGKEGGDEAVRATRPLARGPRVVWSRSGATEWYHNGPLGVEHGFDLSARPAGCTSDGDLELELDVRSGLKPALAGTVDRAWLELRDDAGGGLRYSELSAFDADGKSLPARMTLSPDGTRVVLRVDDRGARYPVQVDPVWAQIGGAIKANSMITGMPVANDALGSAIAVNGDTAVVGAPGSDDQDVDAGAAYIFTRTAAGSWTQAAELLVDVASGAHLGKAVAITDAGGGVKRVIVGAPDDAVGDGTAAWFTGSGTTWTLEQARGPLATGTAFGAAVGVSGDRVIIGAPNYSSKGGFISIMEPMAGVFTEVYTRTGTAGEQLGAAVAIAGSFAASGSPATAAGNGSFTTYLRAAGGGWSQRSTAGGAGAGRLGSALAISGNALVVGSPGSGSGQGSAQIADLDATAAVTGFHAINANGLVAGDGYGTTVAIDGALAIVGAPTRNSSAGDAYIWKLTGGTWSLDYGQALSRKATTAGEMFGTSVAINATTGFAIVGAPGNATPAGSGAFYEFIVRKQNGEACGGDGECASDLCVDNVCCNSTCGRTGGYGTESDNDCQACSATKNTVADGQCLPARAGQLCRAATAGGCDKNAFCQAGNTQCPPSPLKSAGTLCRPAVVAADGTTCDISEVCDGVSAACPATDTKMAAGTICRSATGLCDTAETCDGTSVACPATDAKQPAGTPCRPAVDLCDVAETCDGNAKTCPADALVAAGTPCRAARDECDTAELCDGISRACPIDVTQVDGVQCTGGTCQAGMCRNEADLAVSLTAMPMRATQQNPVSVTVTVQNSGPAPASGVQVQLASNEGATLSSVGGSGFTCQSGAGVVTCTGTDIPAGSAVSFIVSATPPVKLSSFSVSAVVSATTYDPLESNNSASVVVPNDSPLFPGLGGGGCSCEVAGRPAGPNPALPMLFGLGLGILALRRRRVA